MPIPTFFHALLLQLGYAALCTLTPKEFKENFKILETCIASLKHLLQFSYDNSPYKVKENFISQLYCPRHSNFVFLKGLWGKLFSFLLFFLGETFFLKKVSPHKPFRKNKINSKKHTQMPRPYFPHVILRVYYATIFCTTKR